MLPHRIDPSGRGLPQEKKTGRADPKKDAAVDPKPSPEKKDGEADPQKAGGKDLKSVGPKLPKEKMEGLVLKEVAVVIQSLPR